MYMREEILLQLVGNTVFTLELRQPLLNAVAIGVQTIYYD